MYTIKYRTCKNPHSRSHGRQRVKINNEISPLAPTVHQRVKINLVPLGIRLPITVLCRLKNGQLTSTLTVQDKTSRSYSDANMRIVAITLHLVSTVLYLILYGVLSIGGCCRSRVIVPVNIYIYTYNILLPLSLMFRSYDRL